jgi:hypothetical protein
MPTIGDACSRVNPKPPSASAAVMNRMRSGRIP